MIGTADNASISIGRRAAALRLLLGLGCVAALVPLAWLDIGKPQWGLYLSWLAAMVLYLLLWPRPRGVLHWKPSGWLLAGLAAYVALLFAAFCLVYDNWRFGVTGDGLLFYDIGESLVQGHVNPLSVHGIFEQCTVVQASFQNVFMHLSMTLFAHRLGNLLTSTLIILCAVWVAAQTSGVTAAVLLGMFLAVNSVFAFFTIISYPNLAALLPYWAAYAVFLAAARVRHSDFLWAALGVVCGLAPYFLPLWMGAVAVVSAGVVLCTLYWRAPRILLIWAAGILVALAPLLLQFRAWLNLYLVFRPAQGLSLEYFLRIFRQTLLLPITSDLHGYGGEGPWLRPPVGYLFVAGFVLAAASGLLALLRRPRTRALQHAWFWLFVFLGDAAGLALQNSGYANVSIKRAIVLLPAMTFLMILPLAWLAERIGRASVTVALTVAALVPFAYFNATTLWFSPYGFNVHDAMVRMVQEAPGKVLLVTKDPGLLQSYGPSRPPGDPLQRMFRVRDHTIVTPAIPSERSDFDRVVCFSRKIDGEAWGQQLRASLGSLCPRKPVAEITPELECVTCDPE